MEQKLSDTLVKAIDRSNPMMQNLQLASRFNKLVEQSGATDLIFNVKCISFTDSYCLAITFPRSNKVTDIAVSYPDPIPINHYSYNENGYVIDKSASGDGVKVSVVYDGDTYSYTYTGRDYEQHDLIKE